MSWHRRFEAGLAAAALLCVALLLAWVRLEGQAGSARELRRGEPLNGHLIAGATDTIVVPVDAGTFIQLKIDHGGSRLRAVISDGATALAVPRERTGGDREPIVWSIATRSASRLSLGLTSLETAATREYSVTLVESRPARESDDGLSRAEVVLEAPDAKDPMAGARHALELAVAGRDTALRARALWLIGKLHADAGRTQEAERAFGDARTLCREADIAACEAGSALRLGRLLGATGRPDGLRTEVQAADDLAARHGDAAGRAEALVELAGLDLSQTRPADARERLRQALAFARQAGDRRSEGDALNLLGILTNNTGASEEAEASYQAALTLRRAIGDEAGAAQTTSNLGALASSLGEPRRAIGYLEDALATRRRLGNVQAVGNTLHNLGVAYAGVGELETAVGHLEEALGIWRTSGGRRGEAFALQELGQAHNRLGNRQRALDFFTLGRPIWREVGDRRGEAQTLLFVAGILAELGDAARAADTYGAALDLARAGMLRREEGIALLGSSALARRQTDLARAMALATEARGLFESIGNRREAGRADAELGASFHASGRVAEAERALTNALALLAAVEDRSEQAKVGIALAEVHADRDHADSAVAAIGAALDHFESVRRDQQAESFNLSLFASDRPFYDRAIATLMRLHRRAPAAGFDAQALRVSERRRSRRLLDMVASAQAAPAASSDVTALVLDLRRAEERIASKAARLTRLLGDTSTAGRTRASAAKSELVGLIEQADRARAALRARHLSPLTDPLVLSADDVRQGLDARSVLVEYALGEEQSFGWAVTSNAVVAFELPSRATLGPRIHEVVRGLSGGTPMPATARALATTLLGPVRRLLTGRDRLLIVGDGALDAVPFAALPDPETGAPLVARFNIRVLPSASVAAALAGRQTARPRPPDRIAVFADPVYSAADGRLPPASRSRSIEPTTDQTPLRLRFSREESRAIEQLAPGRTTAWTDFAATRARALDGSLSSYRYIHLASHAVIDEELPQVSTIELSRVDERGRAHNGALRLLDVYGLTLNADLVVLSACRTALGAPVAAEGLVGFAGGFLRAGATEVLASLWEVDDRAAAAFMTRFYAALLSQRLPADRALRAAQQALRQDVRWQHPRHWAAWVLIGVAG